MPKSPSKSKKHIDEWCDVRNDPNSREYLFRIGNMLILESEINQKVKNKDYDYKKIEYLKSGLYYPSNISSTYSIWDFNSIENRQSQMSQTDLQI